MLFRICGGLGLLMLGINMLGIAGIPQQLTGALLFIGAIGLLAGI